MLTQMNICSASVESNCYSGVISGFHLGVNEIFALLGYYAVAWNPGRANF